jgi:hypothetical protein
MRIAFDKVDGPLRHALTLSEAKVVFDEIGPLMRQEIQRVRFSNRTDVASGNSGGEQNVFMANDALTICSRGLTKEECVDQIIYFLLRWSHYRWLDQRLLNAHPPADRAPIPQQQIQAKVAPVSKTILDRLSELSRTSEG